MNKFKLISIVIMTIMVINMFVVNVKGSVITECNSWAPGTIGIWYEYDGYYLKLYASNSGEKNVWYDSNFYNIGSSGSNVEIHADIVLNNVVFNNVVGNNIFLAYEKVSENNAGVTVVILNVSGLNIVNGSEISVSFRYSVNRNQRIYTGRVAVSGVVKNGWINYPSFNLLYNNDYNYISNTASFTIEARNFTLNYFSFLNTDLIENGALGGFHLLNYSVSNGKLFCKFDNTFASLPNPHYLVYKVVGVDSRNRSIELSGNVSFNLNQSNGGYNGMKFRFEYEPYISPCERPDIGAGVFRFYVDAGTGYEEVDANSYILIVGSGEVNGNVDSFIVSKVQETPYISRYKIVWNNGSDPIDSPYHFVVRYNGLTFEGNFNPCVQNTIDYDQNGNILDTRTFDWKEAIKQILDFFKSLWNLIVELVKFFGSLLIAILNLVYSLGVALISLLKIVFDFFASVFTIFFGRDNNYHSILNVVNIEDTFTIGNTVFSPQVAVKVDDILRYIHDNIVTKYTGFWSVIAMFMLIERYLLNGGGGGGND